MGYIKSPAYLPEILATAVFLPMGIFMGYIMNFIRTVPNSDLTDLYYGKYWPFFFGGVAAILTGSNYVKHKFEEYKYDHFYFLMVGLSIFVVTAGLIIGRVSQAAAFLGFIAHGMMYVSALSYINIRTGYSRYRHLKLSMPHFVYLVGMSLSATLIWVPFQSQIYRDTVYVKFYSFYAEAINGFLILVTSVILLVGFIKNEIMFRRISTYNYKESLDTDINREVANKDLYRKKYFDITRPGGIDVPNVRPSHPLDSKSSNCGEFGLIIYGLLSKFFTLVFFYYPLVHLFNDTAVFTKLYIKVYFLYWLMTGGFAISICTMMFTNYKLNYILTILYKIPCILVIILIFYYNHFMYLPGNIICFCVMSMALGFGFSHPDINILFYTSLRSNEIVLAIGYFIEHLIVGVLQYLTVFYPETLYNKTTVFYVLPCIGIPFISMILATCAIFAIPKGKHNSLLEAKNSVINDAIRAQNKIDKW